MESVVLSLPIDETAPATARARIREAAKDTDEDLLERTLIIVSEAVAAPVRRRSPPPADERIELHLNVSPSGIAGEVRDGRLGFDVAMHEFDERVAPHLLVIDHLSDRWGLEFGQGARLWFEVRSPSA